MATDACVLCTLKRMPARDQRLLALAAAAAAAAALALLLALAGHPELLAYVSPLLVLALPLAAGRYPGEEAIGQLRSRRGIRRRRLSPAPATPLRRRAAALVPRGGRLIAHALAERGPPLLATS